MDILKEQRYSEKSTWAAARKRHKGPLPALCPSVFNLKPVCSVVPTLYLGLRPQPLSWAPVSRLEGAPLDKLVKADTAQGRQWERGGAGKASRTEAGLSVPGSATVKAVWDRGSGEAEHGNEPVSGRHGLV